MAYRTHCSACHGKRGKGATRLFPPLRGSEWTNGDPGIPIRAILHGVEGPLTVGGEAYMNKMAPLGRALNDGQIAEILTYVRASWGNTGTVVTPEEVAQVREATRGRERSWTETEFRSLLENSVP
jgi:mono/diheme cytochrome c family protein